MGLMDKIKEFFRGPNDEVQPEEETWREPSESPGEPDDAKYESPPRNPNQPREPDE